MAASSKNGFCHRCKIALPSENIRCSGCGYVRFCSKCENEEDHGAVCQRIRDVEYEIQQLLDKVDPDTDIEQFAKFIRRNMDQVYCIWHLAEKYFSPSLYKLFFRYAINMKILKPETQEYGMIFNMRNVGSKV